MKDHKYGIYIRWGITAVIVISISLVISSVFERLEVIFGAVSRIAAILQPITYGAMLAFLMAPVFNSLYAFFGKAIKKFFPKWKKGGKFAKFLATISCLILLIIIVFALIMMIIPQLIVSISSMMEYMPSGLEKLEVWLQGILDNNPALENAVIGNYQDLSSRINDILSTTVLPNLNNYIRGVSTGLLSAVGTVVNFIIGMIVMMYILNMKTTLAAQAKKICYALFSVAAANEIIEETRFIKGMFSKFIVGKIIDSAIIGCLNYIVMSLASMQYALLISVIVGVTNVIPFFGPFVGAIPSAIILLLVSPLASLQFVIWIIILQQVDGNLIGPRILGQTTGLASFWVLFSILLFGGLFGVVGMIIGIPIWAIIYRSVGRICGYFLKRKNLSSDSASYVDLDHIDQESGEYIKEGINRQ